VDFHYSFTPAIVLLAILYLINTLQMANTRNHATNNNTENNGENNNNVANPPPPPPPTLEQALAMQAQMLQTMQQTMVNM
jgi:preprotein translocase subunit SecG